MLIAGLSLTLPALKTNVGKKNMKQSKLDMLPSKRELKPNLSRKKEQEKASAISAWLLDMEQEML